MGAWLLLFDIDGTLLLRASSDHANALREALGRVHRVVIPPGRVEAAGRTDMAIARSMLTLAGISAERIDARTDDVRCLALPTGPYAADELGDADAIATDTTELLALIDQLTAPAPAR